MSSKFHLSLDRDCLARARERRVAWYQSNKERSLLSSFSVPPPPGRIPEYSMRELAEDHDKAIEVQIAAMNWQHESLPETDWLPVFASFHLGQGLIPSMFGATQLVVDDQPPFTEGRILKSIEDVESLPERIDPDNDGWGPHFRELCEKCLDASDGMVPVGVCDHQSPYGVATKLLGNEELILAMYDEPELVERLLTISTNAIHDTIRAMERWIGAENIATNLTMPIPGECGLILWDDYISVISPRMHQQFCQPQNERLYEIFGRGHLHTCGPYFDGYIDAVIACKPISVDITAIRGFARSREDFMQFRRITREHGIKLNGSAWCNPVHFEDRARQTPAEEDTVRALAEGGLLWYENSDLETVKKYARWAKEIEEEIGAVA